MLEWDSEVKGLHLREGKAWYLYYRTRGGQQRRPKLGDHPTLPLTSARSIARKLLARVALGEDPSLDWQTQRSELTLAEAFSLTFSEHWNTPRFKKSGWAAEVKRSFDRHIEAPFGQMKLSRLTADEVDDWHKRMETTPFGANRALEVLSKLYSYSVKKKWAKANPCKGIASFPEPARERFAAAEEIRNVGLELLAIRDSLPREFLFLFLLLLTGSRPRFIERATLAHLTVGPDGVGYLRLPGKTSAKRNRLEEVVIPAGLVQLIQSLPPSETGSLTGIKFPRSTWNKIRERAGCADLWARDLRRTWASVGLSHAAVPLDVLGELMNHASPSTTKAHYARLHQDMRNQAANRIAETIEGMIRRVG